MHFVTGYHSGIIFRPSIQGVSVFHIENFRYRIIVFSIPIVFPLLCYLPLFRRILRCSVCLVKRMKSPHRYSAGLTLDYHFRGIPASYSLTLYFPSCTLSSLPLCPLSHGNIATQVAFEPGMSFKQRQWRPPLEPRSREFFPVIFQIVGPLNFVSFFLDELPVQSPLRFLCSFLSLVSVCSPTICDIWVLPIPCSGRRKKSSRFFNKSFVFTCSGQARCNRSSRIFLGKN